MKYAPRPIRLVAGMCLLLVVGFSLFRMGDSLLETLGRENIGRTGGRVDRIKSVSANKLAKRDRPEGAAVLPQDGAEIRIESASFRLALDEAVIRDPDGRETFVRLDPPATRETLPERLAELADRGAVLPVAYPGGFGGDPAYRRIVTGDLRVRVDDPQRVAAAAGLRVKDLPSYAPGWAVMSAKDPFAAIAAMEKLRTLAGVLSADVLLAVQHSLRTLPNDPLVGDQWHLANGSSPRTHANVEGAWNYGGTGGVKGTGIRIGIVDDGLQTAHPDLAANVDTTNDKDWNGNDSDPNPGFGDDHGTACAGNAAARGNNSLGVAGTAPEATLVGMRLIAGSITDAQEAEGMSYRNDIIEVKSNSWGPSDTGTVLEGPGTLTRAALEDAVVNGRGGKGTIFLWAGGNGGSNGDNSNYDGYANSIETIAVGASDSSGDRSYYSEPGANLVVCAPSDGSSLGITTVDRTGSDGYNTSSSANGGDYTDDFGGTSSAAPTAAGVVALMLDANPNLGWRDVQEILIASAHPIQPADSGWATNSGGLSFHHEFGAGLIDADAAVTLASTWTNLASRVSATSSQTGLSVSIPENNSTGVTRSFDLSASSIRVEHVRLTLSASHTARGNLEVVLTSPGGMSSRLAEVHSDSNNHYSSWSFSSVRHWGELSTGNWTLKVADRSSSGNSNGGTLTAAVLEVFGSPGVPVNPAPLVQITSPADGQVFSPGITVDVTVSAEDYTAGGAAGTVTGVELFANGVSLGTDTSAPYQFSWSPANGSHSLVAEATDDESAVGTSATVNVEVVNQPPVISAATLDAAGQQYSDTPLAVASVSASDPESAPLTFSYQWQSSDNGVSYTDETGETADTLAPSASHVAKLWRCVITASDGEVAGDPFTTDSVNLLHRPVTTATAGDPYSHASGLVLRGTETTLSRRAIVQEFSQGPPGASSEWIEILVLQETGFAFWDLQDAAGNIIVFRDDPVWDDIPAGTLIVVYNGNSKDPLLPADDGDPADGRMVVSSTDTTYFESGFDDWPSLGNSGDSIFLSDDNSVEVHSIAYGNSTATTPNVGSVGSGDSAYYAGDTDDGADLAANWQVTSSTVARRLPRAAGDLFISEYVEGTSNNKALEFFNPSGATIDLSAAGYTIEIYFNGSSSPGQTINLSGSVPAGGVFVIAHSSASGFTSDQTSGVLQFNGDDAIVLKKAGAVVDSFGQVGVDPGSAWTSGGVTTRNETLRRNASVVEGDVLANDSFDPSIEWAAAGLDEFSGLGSHSVVGGDPYFTVSISPSSFMESAGAAAASGTVTVSEAPAADLTVTLTSADPGEATVPASVVISAGTTSAPFAVDAVDDPDQDGTQPVAITASATGFTSGVTVVTVGDDEAPLEGVTPGAANTPANEGFVDALRNGLLNSPALFRAGSGANIPLGLALDTSTGLLSGTIDPSNPAGDHLIIIERYNTLDEVVVESFVLTLSDAAADDFATWIAGFTTNGLDGADEDADFDGLPNSVENYLGTRPDIPSRGLVMISSGAGTLVFRHTRSNEIASDLSGGYEWSPDLVNWYPSGAATPGGTVGIAAAVVEDLAAPDNDIVEVACTPTGPSLVFVRLVVERQ